MRHLTLYYSPGSCSLAIHAALRQAELTFDLVKVDTRLGEQRSDAFLALNPQGRVPALAVDGRVFDEVPALADWIAGTVPAAGLFPNELLARTEALRWIGRLHSDLHPLFRALWRPAFFSADAASHDGICQSARQRLFAHYKALNQALQDGVVFNSRRPGFVDLYAAVFLRWSSCFSESPLDSAALAYRQQIAQHPPLAAALDIEGVNLDNLKRSTDP